MAHKRQAAAAALGVTVLGLITLLALLSAAYVLSLERAEPASTEPPATTTTTTAQAEPATEPPTTSTQPATTSTSSSTTSTTASSTTSTIRVRLPDYTPKRQPLTIDPPASCLAPK